MTPRRLLEIRVGAFIVGGIALLIFFIFAIGDLSSFFVQRYALRVRFDSANGITSGSPVQYAGVEKGKIQAVRLVADENGMNPEVELLVSLPTDIRVYSDDVAAISTLGLLGEKFLDISPGQQVGPVIQPGGVLIGKPPISTEQVIERSSQVLKQLEQTLSGLNSLVGDQEARIFLKETLQEARDATRNWKVLGERLNLAMSHVESGEGNMGKMLYDERLYNETVDFVGDLRSNPWKLLFRPRGSKKK